MSMSKASAMRSVGSLLVVLALACWFSVAQPRPYLKVAVTSIFKSSGCTAGSAEPELRYFHASEQARHWLGSQLGTSVRRVALPSNMLYIGLSGGTHNTTGYGILVSDGAIRTADGRLLLQTRWVRPDNEDDVLALQMETCLLLGVPTGNYSAISVLDQRGHTRLKTDMVQASQ